MKFLKYKLTILSLVLVSLATFISCEDNKSGVEIISFEARFVTETNVNVISFINASQNAVRYEWDFGEADATSTLQNPTYTYCNNGSYDVVLKAYDVDNNMDTFQSTIVIDLPCEVECSENISPAIGNLNWTFLNGNGNSAFDAFGNIGGGIVANPVTDAVNSSCNVYNYTKITGCETWSGAGYVLDTSLDFSTMTSKIFKVKVLAETQLTDVTLLLEFQPFPNNNPFEARVASITQLGEWQELTFDFSGVNTGTFKNMVIYFDRGAPCDGDVYYFDDLIQE